jgi:hypothetical protein
MGQPIGDYGGKYGKSGENKRNNNIQTYVKAGLFHGVVVDLFVQVRGFASTGMLEFWNIGIMGSGLRLGEDNGMMGLGNQNEYNSY